MYGVSVLYDILAQPVGNAKYAGEMRVRDALELNDLDGSIIEVSATGDPVMDESLSVEVEVVFPGVYSDSELPDLESVFSEAECISEISVSEA